jgi:hypothetical protein
MAKSFLLEYHCVSDRSDTPVQMTAMKLGDSRATQPESEKK